MKNMYEDLDDPEVQQAFAEETHDLQKIRTRFSRALKARREKAIRDENDGYQSGFKLYDFRMENIQPGMHLVGGISNIGKTAWMTQLALQFAEYNPDQFVLYVSIDDDFNLAVTRILAHLGQIPVQAARKPNVYARNKNLTDQEIAKLGMQLGNAETKLGRLSFEVIDINIMQKLEELEHHIQIIKFAHGKKVAVFLDNFHKLRTKNFNSPRERFTYVSEELKRIQVQNDMVFFSTVELTKLGHKGRPNIENVKETVDIIYDATTIHMLHQDFHSKDGKTEFFHMHNGTRLPVLEVSVVKNKANGYKGRFYYKFYPETMSFVECDGAEQRKYSLIKMGDDE
jgi:replicative DNA helicase